ncbi:MAG: nucleotidyltransferase domain-containing protein [Candidatus Eremiobacteraeota bacterium]|nr:nucleotidyltransferase domain-containing protein [Candidatus Eremiobacteraeota bacterium]
MSDTKTPNIQLQVITKFKKLLSVGLGEYTVVLFGSRARGDSDPLSDMDVVVIAEDNNSPALQDFVGQCAWEAGYEEGIVVVPIVFTRNEWNSSVTQNTLLFRAVASEGIAV